MIRLEMHGRLGNQMFRYAFARKLQIKTGLPIIVSFHFVRLMYSPQKTAVWDKGWENSLQYFNVAPMQEYKGSRRVLFYKPDFPQCLIACAFILYCKKFRGASLMSLANKQLSWKKILDVLGVFCISNAYVEYKNFKRKNYYIDGSFECSKYFNDIRDILLNEFTPKQPIMEHNKNLQEILTQRNSVCVTIRTFKEIEDNNSMHNLYDVCDKEYYKRGMSYMASKIENPLFYVCSDDVQWVKENMDLGNFDIIYEKGNDPVWEKLRLMYSCKNFVIGNSTFSWWAQYLSRNENKIVVTPKRWFNDEFQGYLIEDWMIKM